MSQPINYTPTTDFSQQETINASGRSTVNTAALDAEFAAIEVTLDQTLSNLSIIQRDDGRLRDVIVDIYTLSPDVLNLMGGFNLRGLWATATVYAVNDICSNGAYTYVCRTAHTSGGSFDSSKWIQFGFTSGADAAAAAAAAQVSATSASGSATAAASSATNAANSATSASSSSSSASASATTASTKASEAVTSATSAANYAAAAANSASSISFPITVANGGTGATTASSARSNLGLGTAATANVGTAANNVVQLTAAAEMPIISGVATPGEIIFTARTTAPVGYLKANGAAVSRSTYSALFSAIGTVFGSGDGSTTFNLPDLREKFIRGFTDGKNVNDSGRVFGTSQNSEFMSHSHGLGARPNMTAGGGVTIESSISYGAGAGTTATAGGTETRPENVALLACIKY